MDVLLLSLPDQIASLGPEYKESEIFHLVQCTAQTSYDDAQVRVA